MNKSNTVEIIIRAKDAASGAFKNAAGATDIFRKRIKSLTGTVFNLKTAFAGALASVGIGAVAKGFLDTASAFEKYETVLKTITGSSEKARESMDWITEFTAKTPYDLDQVTDSFVKLSSYGLDATKDLKILGDTASAMGKPLSSAVEMFADAATGEFERLKEFGIRASQQGDNVTFKWMQNGRQMVKTAEKTQTGITASLSEIFEARFAGAMGKFSNTFEGMWSNLKDQFTLFQLAVMEGGVFDYLKSVLRLLLEKVNNLKKQGKLKEWASETAQKVIKAFSLIAKGAGLVADSFRGWQMIWEGLKGGFNLFAAGITAGLKKLLETARVVAEKLHLGSFADKLTAQINSLAGAQKKYSVKVEESAENLEKLSSKSSVYKKISGLLDDAAKKAKNFANETKNAAKAAVAPVKTLDKPPVASDDALAISHLARLKATTRTALLMLTDTYKKGETTLEEYFSRRKALIETQFAEEISLLQKSADAQTDPDKKLALEDQIFSKQQAHTQALLALKQQQMTAEDELVRKKTETADLLADLEKRAEPGTGSGLDAVFTEELAQMDARHAEELSRLQELTASKSEIEDAYRMQKLEKEKLLADQEKRIHDQNLQNAKTIAGGTADVFTNLYELTGKKHKEFFILAKTAAIAEALISTYQGAQQAFTSLSGIPIVGPALGAAAATAAVLAGLARVASIKAQKLAAGGFVAGHSPSPTADNIPIMATAGEFMQPVSAVQHYGHSVMEAIKKRLIPREVFQGFTLPGLPSLNPSFAYAAGGMVNAAPSTSGSQQGTEINIVNIIDPEEIEDYMNSPGGENAIMNVISSKKRTIERILF